MINWRVQINSNITGVTSDSRRVKPGYLFAALPGTKIDGREFIPQALENGAIAILAETNTPHLIENIEYVESDNPRRDYAYLCASFYQKQPDYIVAVTGTNGKTSTVNFVQQIWQILGENSASLGTLGVKTADEFIEGAMTTPDPQVMHEILAELTEKKITHTALEASSHGLDQCRLEGVKLKAAAFTNLTQDHLDYHGDMDSYFLAKARLFGKLLPSNGVAVLNTDMDYFEKAKEVCLKQNLKVTGYGQRADEYLVYSDPVAVSNGYHLHFKIEGKGYDINIPLVGRFQVDNALAAMLLVLSEGKHALEDIIQAVENLKPVRGRLESVQGHPKGAGVFVDYAHTPDALVSALSSLKHHAHGKIIGVFGCGGDRDKTKRPLMASAVNQNADVAILTDDNPRTEDAAAIRADALKGAPDAIEIGDRYQAIKHAVHLAEKNDIVLIAGKGHEQGQEIMGVKHPFDDVTEAKKAMREIS